ncbi:hypothetical protein C0J52_09142 [Blattella germanica]|nr:hypothetical protein C0J52_09142 [Blattella germanica]
MSSVVLVFFPRLRVILQNFTSLEIAVSHEVGLENGNGYDTISGRCRTLKEVFFLLALDYDDDILWGPPVASQSRDSSTGPLSLAREGPAPPDVVALSLSPKTTTPSHCALMNSESFALMALAARAPVRASSDCTRREVTYFNMADNGLRRVRGYFYRFSISWGWGWGGSLLRRSSLLFLLSSISLMTSGRRCKWIGCGGGL